MPRNASTTKSDPVLPHPDFSRLSAIQDALLAWFGECGRNLPWRHTRDPWAILVSEVMLQQIQVARAIPFYEAFLDRFPTIQSLADAPLADAIRVWGDLGRYRRIVHLHRTARIIVEVHGGLVPDDEAVLRSLPGIGPYTAGAVACFAYGHDTGFIDTNMRRVLHRVFLGADVPAPMVRDRELQTLAIAAVPSGRGWAWNQGLMDLGARVCTARKPACDQCPLGPHCTARPTIQGALDAAPRKSAGATPAYDSTNRYFRGRILAELRAIPPVPPENGITMPDLGQRVRPGFEPTDLPWLQEIVSGLAKDGLAAVAEDRPRYDAVDTDRPSTLRIKLP
ncbi:MAG: A/G-specific adenine glycosylase [uncultured Thermomicrobiales bacterium]|uniref:Adenine DNA glycosylase n=1 Tax=uncultured Thermomicrobiales bacterium TaxID=1645740 RepID=A0A6J4UNR3_9BACT|nr:MAG: A/G-specific adenine glycosylase [uncultured Thermomicrobiales bacterium]